MKTVDVDDVPALRGSSAPLKNEEDAPESEGVDFLIAEALRDDPRPLYVTCQGALTDVAAALNRRPEIAEKLTVVWIGGFPYPAGGPEFNLLQDVPAARAVMASPGQLSGSCRSTYTAPWRSVLRSWPPGSAPAAR